MRSLGNALVVVDKKTTSKHVRVLRKAYVMFPLQNKHILTAPFPKCHQNTIKLANVSGEEVAKLLNIFRASNRYFLPFPFCHDKSFLGSLTAARGPAWGWHLAGLGVAVIGDSPPGFIDVARRSLRLCFFSTAC